MSQIFNSNGTIVCRNIPADINRIEITEIFNKRNNFFVLYKLKKMVRCWEMEYILGKKIVMYFLLTYVHITKNLLLELLLLLTRCFSFNTALNTALNTAFRTASSSSFSNTLLLPFLPTLYQSLKDSKAPEHDFKLSLSKSDELKYKAIKGIEIKLLHFIELNIGNHKRDTKSIEQLKHIYKNNEQLIITEEMRNEFINEINEYIPELSKKKREDNEKKKQDSEKKKDKSFILNLLTNVDEPRENEQDNKLKEELKNYLNLNCLCAYNFDENNKLDNYLIPTFPN
ncbi:hypothetical protein [Plasmodium yoelii yoelii]|uniref:Uncharacterized protein n=1 Tax=Plasmodium yoelii yoelii TaxID=73239 RepID=Q7RQH3_PLAYO|nr:hypothetical protein [Plasmodium yoelii yoelii]